MLPKKIIFEGIDASGKSLFIQLLQKVNGYKIIHSKELFYVLDEEVKNIEALATKAEEFFEFIEKQNKVIYDRNFLSILVYIIQRNPDFGKNKFLILRYIKKWLKALDNGSIICLSSNYYRVSTRLIYRSARLKEELSPNDEKLLEDENFFKQYNDIFISLSILTQRLIQKENLDIKMHHIDTSLVPLTSIRVYYKLYSMRKKIRRGEELIPNNE